MNTMWTALIVNLVPSSAIWWNFLKIYIFICEREREREHEKWKGYRERERERILKKTPH